ncbi:MAG: hypothetical protein IPO97_04475 [Sphingomonadales bacterium]|nr:hypothetical protein [Sphingomonadales bacterium]
MTKRRYISVMALLACQQAPAIAQDQVISGSSSSRRERVEPPIGSLLGNRLTKENMDPAQAVRLAHQAAACWVAQRKGAARAAASALTLEEREKGFETLKKETPCDSAALNGITERASWTVPLDVKTGMLAEALLRTSKGPALAALPLEQSYVRPWFGLSSRNLVIDEMAACVADTNPAGVSALFKTRPESDKEKTAISTLAASFGPCLRAGAKLRANSMGLRAALAEAMWQRALQPAPVLAGGAH